MATPPNQEPTTGPSRRTLAKGAAWSVPVIAMSAAAPAMAASPNSCSVGTISYPRNFTNGGVIPIRLANGDSVYAKIQADTSNSRTTGSTGRYNLTYGSTAYDSNSRRTYNINPTGRRALVLNQSSEAGSSESVTVSFYKDAAATQRTEVFNVQVPIDDISIGVKVRGILIGTVWPWGSYQDKVQLTGNTLDGERLIPAATDIKPHYGRFTSDYLKGDPVSGWYVDQSAVDRPSRRSSMGGTLFTTFGVARVHSFTLRYSGGTQSKTRNWYGAQGLGMGTFEVCA